MNNKILKKIYTLVIIDALINKKDQNGCIDLGNHELKYELEVIESLSSNYTWAANLLISTKIVSKESGKAIWGYTYSKKVPEFKWDLEIDMTMLKSKRVIDVLLNLPISKKLAFIVKQDNFITKDMYVSPWSIPYREFIDEFVSYEPEDRGIPSITYPSNLSSDTITIIDTLGYNLLKELGIDNPELLTQFTQDEKTLLSLNDNDEINRIKISQYPLQQSIFKNLYLGNNDEDEEFSLTRK